MTHDRLDVEFTIGWGETRKPLVRRRRSTPDRRDTDARSMADQVMTFESEKMKPTEDVAAKQDEIEPGARGKTDYHGLTASASLVRGRLGDGSATSRSGSIVLSMERKRQSNDLTNGMPRF